jgi:hypothetical protein
MQFHGMSRPIPGFINANSLTIATRLTKISIGGLPGLQHYTYCSSKRQGSSTANGPNALSCIPLIVTASFLICTSLHFRSNCLQMKARSVISRSSTPLYLHHHDSIRSCSHSFNLINETAGNKVIRVLERIPIRPDSMLDSLFRCEAQKVEDDRRNAVIPARVLATLLRVLCTRHGCRVAAHRFAILLEEECLGAIPYYGNPWAFHWLLTSTNSRSPQWSRLYCKEGVSPGLNVDSSTEELLW